MVEDVPAYWKSEFSDVEEMVKTVKKGKAEVIGQSAGGRKLHLIRYGEKNNVKRTTNLCNALGAHEPKCYADRSAPDYRQTILLVGTTHGGEMEAIAALLNLVQILETGYDLKGEAQPRLSRLDEVCNLLIIPCLNPDGRCRVPLKSFVGQPKSVMRYYNQGTRKGGELFGWPDCMKVHPIKEASEFLGGYFNDDGINLSNDDFFLGMAGENQALFRLANDYAPDFILMLHGGDKPQKNYFMKTRYAPQFVKDAILPYAKRIEEQCAREGLGFCVARRPYDENTNPPCAFGLGSALYHLTGAPTITYECDQGIEVDGEYMSHDLILRHHMILFEELQNFIEEGGKFIV